MSFSISVGLMSGLKNLITTPLESSKNFPKFHGTYLASLVPHFKELFKRKYL